MTSEAHTDTAAPEPPRSGISLRFTLASGPTSIPLDRLHHLAGYATLTGEADDYFLGWLSMRGEPVPVFDLNRVVCDQPTPENFGSRIMVVRAGTESPTPFIGLLAGGITDTITHTMSTDAEALDLDSYLPMLYSLIPAVPDRTV